MIHLVEIMQSSIRLYGVCDTGKTWMSLSSSKFPTQMETPEWNSTFDLDFSNFVPMSHDLPMCLAGSEKES